MKSLIVYYSHFGNTAHVADKMHDVLLKLGEANLFELQYRQGKKRLFQQLIYRLFPSSVELSPVPTDPKDYDVVCMCIPVWAGYPPPPVAKYIGICKSAVNKKFICCYIYGIETSLKMCAKRVKNALRKKGYTAIIDMFVPWTNVHNSEFLNKAINEAVEKIKSI